MYTKAALGAAATVSMRSYAASEEESAVADAAAPEVMNIVVGYGAVRGVSQAVSAVASRFFAALGHHSPPSLCSSGHYESRFPMLSVCSTTRATRCSRRERTIPVVIRARTCMHTYNINRSAPHFPSLRPLSHPFSPHFSPFLPWNPFISRNNRTIFTETAYFYAFFC